MKIINKIRRVEPVNTGFLTRTKLLYIFLGIITILILVTTVVITANQSSDDEKATQSAMEAFEKEQAEKSEELAEKAAAEEEHYHSLDIQFADLSAGEFQKSGCDRLRNRSGIILYNGCNYNISARGKLNMAVVYVYEFDKSGLSRLDNRDSGNKEAIRYVNTYLKQQAARYKVKDPPSVAITSYGPYNVTKGVIGKYYRTEGRDILNIFSETSRVNKVPEGDYDMVHYVLLDNIYGGVAASGIHRAFTYNSGTTAVPTFIHETLHLFGARDKYNNNDCSTIGTNDPFGRYNGTLPGSDIMCSNFSVDGSNINDITAREIGWAN